MMIKSSGATATNRQSISVFFPCYNDAESIGSLVRAAKAVLQRVVKDWEIIVVNDGSTDKSAEILQMLRKTTPRLRIVTHPENRGYGAALKSGFAVARKSLIFYTDGDGQYDVNGLIELLPLMTKDTDFVNGIKIVRKDPTYRVIIGNLYNFLVRWLFWLPVQDVDCDYRLIRKKIINQITLSVNSGAICVELVKKAQAAGARFREVSVNHYDRQYGASQFFRPGRIIRTFVDLVALWMQLILRNKTIKYISYANQ